MILTLSFSPTPFKASLSLLLNKDMEFPGQDTIPCDILIIVDFHLLADFQSVFMNFTHTKKMFLGAIKRRRRRRRRSSSSGGGHCYTSLADYECYMERKV